MTGDYWLIPVRFQARKGGSMPIHEIRPMIPIADLERSLDFYVRGLGLKLLDERALKVGPIRMLVF